jgi:hypothetical protein
MPGWEAFFSAQLAASAALTGLLFVGISLNLAKILSHPALPDRALAGFYLLMAILVSSSVLLLPEQPPGLVGTEVLIIGSVLWLAGTRLDIASLRKSAIEHRRHFVQHSIMFQVSVIPYVIGGIVVLTGRHGGLYWVAAAVMLSLITAVLEAWVLLVEINR